MAFLSPGVFLEEIPSEVQVIAGVSTSIGAFLGFSPRGPVNDPQFVTDFGQYTNVFGPLTKDSFMPLSVAAFFANGGANAYITRVVPADATSADADIDSATADQNIETGDGTATAFAKTDATTTLKVNSGASPIVPGSVSMRWRAANAASTAQLTYQRDATTRLNGDAVNTVYEGRINGGASASGSIQFTGAFAGPLADNESFTLDNGTTTQLFEFDVSGSTTPVAGSIVIDYATGFGVAAITNDATLVDAIAAAINSTTWFYAVSDGVDLVTILVVAAGIAGNVTSWVDTVGATTPTIIQPTGGLAVTSIDEALALVVGGTVTLNWMEAAVAKSAALSTKGDTWTYSATGGDLGTGGAIVDIRTGMFSFEGGAAVDAAAITVGYTSTVDKTATETVALDGTLQGDITTGTMDYTDGSYTLDLTSHVPHGPATAGDGSPILINYSILAWDMDPISAGAWGADLRVIVSGSDDYYTAATGQYTRFDVEVQLKNSADAYEVKENYDELHFTDSTSAFYFADVINDLSDYISVTEPAGDEPPLQLQAQSHTRVIAAGGDGTTTGLPAVTAGLGNAAVQPRTVSISYMSSTVSKTITDDGNGNLIGSVNASGTNTIVYATGVMNFTIASGDAIDAGSLVVASYYEAPTEATHTEDFLGGSDGTFDTTNYGRLQVSSPTLQAAEEGIYAFDVVEQILNLVVPDFVGDLAITGDILDYCDSRESRPSGRDRFAILAVPAGSTGQEAHDWMRFDLNRFSKNAAMYWPHIKVADPLSNNRDLLLPPMGHIAGIFARTDANKNVAKSPGGTVDGQLRFLTGLELKPTQGARDLVSPARINSLIDTTGTGRAVWGVRTMSNESDWTYVNVSRVFMFLASAIFNATQWTVFENNGPVLWTRIKSQLDGFLGNLFSEGWFAGASPSEAFLVTVDSSNNPQSVIDAGQIIVDVAVAPSKPAEFVRFRLTQKNLT